MIKIADVVKNIIISDSVALEASKKGLLNISAYAKKIKKTVEIQAHKPVNKATIVTSLSRIIQNLEKIPSIYPDVEVERTILISPLFEITLPKNTLALKVVKDLYAQIQPSNTNFVTVTQGVGEITIIASHALQALIKNLCKKNRIKPAMELENLLAVNIKFKEEYISQPNIIFALLNKLAVKKINVVEIVSTYTELTIVIESKNMKTAFDTLNS